jgi:hypothetical protein
MQKETRLMKPIMTDEERRAAKREYNRAWQAKNPDYNRAWAAKNREKINEKRRGNPTKLAYNREYYATHKEQYREKGRLWIEKNRPKTRESSRAYKSANRDKVRSAAKAAYAAARETHRERRRSKWEVLLGRPKPDKCDACGGKEGSGRGSDGIVFDHCHEMGHPRGWLCGHCNTALGLLSDDRERLLKLVAYLDRTKGGTSPQLALSGI